jgi:gluconokinase
MSRTRFVVVTGVSGSGKTTLAQGIAQHLGWVLLEGDDLHPPANVERMAAGTPLNDEDRRPWLEAIGAWLDDHVRTGSNAVLTCSALRRSYRDLLRTGRPGVCFCHVTADAGLITERVARWSGHYMPPSLLPSQLATLEPLAPDEPGITLSSAGSADEVLAEALHRLGLDAAGGTR